MQSATSAKWELIQAQKQGLAQAERSEDVPEENGGWHKRSEAKTCLRKTGAGTSAA